MTDKVLEPVSYNQNPRVGQRDIYPQSVKTRHADPSFISNTVTFLSGAFSIANNGALTIRSVVQGSLGRKLALGAVPYSIVFFQDSLSTTKVIGVGVLNPGYIIQGPFSVPPFSPNATLNDPSGTQGGSDGNDLVFCTTLINTTGFSQTIFYATNTRFIQAKGAAFSTS